MTEMCFTRFVSFHTGNVSLHVARGVACRSYVLQVGLALLLLHFIVIVTFYMLTL